MLYHDVKTMVKQNYAFSIIKKINSKKYLVYVRNYFDIKDNFEILSKNYKTNQPIKIVSMNIDDKSETIARTPMKQAIITFNKNINLSENDIGRIV
jgi:hypothetical protein